MATSPSSSQPTFTESLEELESIVQRFRSENVPLEEAMALFETGVSHMKVCQRYLDTAKGKIEILVQGLQENDGTPDTAPFDEQ